MEKFNCEACGYQMRPEHAHDVCDRCGWVSHCCEGDQCQPSFEINKTES